jgi:hypothetical protein
MPDVLAVGELEADVLVAGVLEVEADVLVDDVLEDDDEHPPISPATTITAAPHATLRARLSLNMVLTLSFREKGRTNRSPLNPRPARLRQNVPAHSRRDQDHELRSPTENIGWPNKSGSCAGAYNRRARVFQQHPGDSLNKAPQCPTFIPQFHVTHCHMSHTGRCALMLLSVVSRGSYQSFLVPGGSSVINSGRVAALPAALPAVLGVTGPLDSQDEARGPLT